MPQPYSKHPRSPLPDSPDTKLEGLDSLKNVVLQNEINLIERYLGDLLHDLLKTDK